MAFIRKRGRYWYVYWYANGKTHNRSCKTANKNLAEKIRRKVEDELSSKKFQVENIDDSISLFDFFDEVLQHRKTNKSKRTYELDTEATKSFKSFTGNGPLKSIDVRKIEEYKTHLFKSLKASTVNINFRHLRSLFSVGVKYKYIISNPFKESDELPTPKKLPAYITKEKADELLELTRDRKIHTPIMIALYTGARISEVCKMKWGDVDLKDKTVVLDGKGKKERLVPIPDKLARYLDQIKEKDLDPEFVIHGSRDQNTVTRQFRKYANECDIKQTFHNLRDTYASWLVQMGVSLQVVQKLLGHESIKTTMIYAHLAPNNLRDAVNKLV